MNLYSIEMKLCATIYVKAESEEEAMGKAKTFSTDTFDLYADGITISDRNYDDPRLPEISLSPAMTGHGFWGQDETPDLVEEGVPEPEE